MITIQQAIENIHKLPTVPSVVQELLVSFGNDDVDIEAIASKISRDQVISAKVLRMANSAQFRRAREVATINDAVLMLGFGNVRTLVIASGVASMKVEIPGLDRLAFWRHSLDTAGIAKWMGGLAKTNADICFAAGLLHGIGQLLMRVTDAEAYGRVDIEVGAGMRRASTEKSIFGFDHAEVGAELARRWNFPEDIAGAIRGYVDPFAMREFSVPAGVLHLAAQIVDGYEAEHNPGEVACEISSEVVARLHVDSSRIFQELPEIWSSLAEWEQLLG